MSFHITDDCMACGDCIVVCPEHAIEDMERRDAAQGHQSATISRFYHINGGCTECGFCIEVCPVRAVIREHGQ